MLRGAGRADFLFPSPPHPTAEPGGRLGSWGGGGVVAPKTSPSVAHHSPIIGHLLCARPAAEYSRDAATIGEVRVRDWSPAGLGGPARGADAERRDSVPRWPLLPISVQFRAGRN
jgi:hypothetical protein